MRVTLTKLLLCFTYLIASPGWSASGSLTCEQVKTLSPVGFGNVAHTQVCLALVRPSQIRNLRYLEVEPINHGWCDKQIAIRKVSQSHKNGSRMTFDVSCVEVSKYSIAYSLSHSAGERILIYGARNWKAWKQ
jgi:hypothetical protein